MISLQQAHKQYGGKVIFDRVSVSFAAGDRAGLIGPNGAGKTVLLRVIDGQEELDHGTVSIPQNLRIGYLPQDMDVPLESSPLDFVLAPFRALMETHGVFEQLAQTEEGSAEYDKRASEIDRLLEAQKLHDVFSVESRAEAILAGLGVPEASWSLPLNQLSGGYRMRVALGGLLLLSPDFLLLDEPTNHLDLDSLIWLEKFLLGFDGGLILVSHDRDFLQRATSRTIHLAGGRLESFNGPVASYLSWKSEQNAVQERRYKNISAKIAQTERFIERFKAKATKATQAHSKEKQLERLREELPEQHNQAPELRFSLKESLRSGAAPLRFEDASLGYGDLAVIERVSITVQRGDKIAVIGPNGAGKSTFLKTCAGLLQTLSGDIILGQNTEIRYFSQHRLDQLDPARTLYDTIAAAGPSLTRTEIQSILGAFMFSGDDVLKKVGVLSGGEKSRMSLAAILADPGNVLLLDEPTNHLDIQSIERLANVLGDFSGTLVIVSHDEYFLSRVTNRVFEIRPGTFRDFPGTLADYRSLREGGWIDEGLHNEQDTQHERFPQTDKKQRMQRRRERKSLEREIEKIERGIEERENAMAELKQQIADPAFATDFQKLQEFDQRLRESQNDYDRLLIQWDKLQEQLQRMPV